MRRAAESCNVIFFEEPLESDTAAPSLQHQTSPEGVRVVTPILPTRFNPVERDRAQASLLNELLMQYDQDAIAWYYTPSALRFTRGQRFSLSIYDNMDELSAFKGASADLLSLETDLLRRVDLVFTGGYSLYHAKKPRHPNVHAFPSSVDRLHFSRPDSLPPPPGDLAAIGSPRIGFFGVIDERLDLDLVAALAKLRPDWNLVMIGPIAKIDSRHLPQAPNIHWLGGKAYADLPNYLHHLDCGFMPFAINEATRFISPTKTPEFLSAGLPVVSTPIADVVRPYGISGLVAIAATAKEFVPAIESALRAPAAEWREAVDRYLSTTSWDLTWAAMLSLIEEVQPAAIPPQSEGVHGGILV